MNVTISETEKHHDVVLAPVFSFQFYHDLHLPEFTSERLGGLVD